MAISDKTRKRLWAKSGNRCAVCKEELFNGSDEDLGAVNIGEECHIISSKTAGPRHKAELPSYDSYDNLLLLCRNHHKEIDTLTETFTEELLRYLKTSHENWVFQSLQSTLKAPSNNAPQYLKRIFSGKELVAIISDTHAYRSDYDEQDDSNENEYLGSILQVLTDYGDLFGMIDIEPAQQAKISTELKTMLNELNGRGYGLFADRGIEDITLDGSTHKDFNVATLLIKNVQGD